jgi:hypothetical protein
MVKAQNIIQSFQSNKSLNPQHSSELLDYSYLYYEAHRKKSIIERIKGITYYDIRMFLLEIPEAISKIPYIIIISY